MVRLEKIAYEQIVNTAALGRSRVITTPQKWNSVNHMDHTRSKPIFYRRIDPQRIQLLFGKINQTLHPILRQHRKKSRKRIRLTKRFGKYLLTLQTWEDTKLHHDNELRRNIMFEYIARQTYAFT